VHMRIEIAKLHKALATTIIYVTHDQVEAMTLADKIVVLRAGVVEQVGTPLDLYDNPANLFVAGFIGSPKMNFFAGTVAAASNCQVIVKLDDFGDNAIPVSYKSNGLEVGTKVTVGIRPEQFAETGAAGLNLTIDMMEHLGGESFAYARHGAGDLVIVKMHNGRNLKSGETLNARFDPGVALLFDDKGKRIY